MKTVIIFVISLILFTSQAFAQTEFLDTFSKYLTPQFIAWFILVVAMGAVAAFISRRLIAMILVRESVLSNWLKVGERVLGFSFLVNLLVALFFTQPGIIADTKALELLPLWQSIIVIGVIGLFGSSGNKDLETQKALWTQKQNLKLKTNELGEEEEKK